MGARISNKALESESWNFVLGGCDLLIAGETSRAVLSVLLSSVMGKRFWEGAKEKKKL
jgi:hypothetical protein